MVFSRGITAAVYRACWSEHVHHLEHLARQRREVWSSP